MGEQSARSNRPIVIAIVAGALFIAVGLAVGLVIGLRDDDDDNKVTITSDGNEDCHSHAPEPDHEHFKSAYGKYRYASVVADCEICSEIGTEIMARKRGNAIDAAVATMFAIGIVNAHSCGIGGGSFIVVYDKETDTWLAVISRETAPGNATQDMYKDNIRLSLDGGLAIGVPGEVLGLYYIHQRMGKLPWAEVVSPSVKLCQDGVPITAEVHQALVRTMTTPERKAGFEVYFDQNGDILPIGTVVRLPKLAQTFQTISNDPTSFYNGSLAADIVADIQEAGGIIMEQDMHDYQLRVSSPTVLSLPGYKVYSIPAPGSGPVLNYILNIMSGYNLTSDDVADKESKILTYHRIIEAFKFAYGKRTQLGDAAFVDVSEHVGNMSSLAFGEATRALINDSYTQGTAYYNPNAAILSDHGTSHLSVIDGMGNAVAITSTINTYFGSKVKGNRTGIVFNNEMNDFSVPGTVNFFGLPASPANFISPGKRPQSSMSPAIVWDETNKRVRMISGASGGSKITTSTAMNIMEVLWLNISIPASVDRSRFHHQLIPTYLQLETDFPQDIKAGLEAKGHETGAMSGKSVIQALSVSDDGIVGVSDFRKGGEPDGF